MTGAGIVPIRVGQGTDFHRFSEDPERPLIIGGVAIEGERVQGLDGHSDADVLAHALSDAVLGAAQLGDLGAHFPSSDPAWAGADSMELLSRTLGLAAAAGWVPVNADCTVIAQVPRLAPFTDRMAEQLTAAAGAPVSVKATTTDGMGAIGRAEGIGALAVVLLAADPGRGRA